MTEAIKLAFADRDAFYGDPDFVDVPIDQLLSDAYNDERRKLIGDRASIELRHGTLAVSAATSTCSGRGAGRRSGRAARWQGGGRFG